MISLRIFFLLVCFVNLIIFIELQLHKIVCIYIENGRYQMWGCHRCFNISVFSIWQTFGNSVFALMSSSYVELIGMCYKDNSDNMHYYFSNCPFRIQIPSSFVFVDRSQLQTSEQFLWRTNTAS